MPPMTDYLSSLNDKQRQAVLHGDGPALVLAGAGSGKTRVLTTRAAHLMADKGVLPDEILMVTFTNKAAGEMKTRVKKLTNLELSHIGTFHSLAARILRREAPTLGLDQHFSIYDTDDQLALLKTIYKKQGLSAKDYHPRSISAEIGKAKQQLLTPEEYAAIAHGSYQTFAAQVYKLYQRSLGDAHALDFEDLLLRLVELLRDHEPTRRRYQQQFTHVLVDEYQDTNQAQYLITKYLAAPQHNLFAVGDFSQSIYAWRGADYRNMLNLKKDFANLTEYQLQQNYRSSQGILSTATEVIRHNTNHPILELWTDNSDSSKPQLYTAADQNHEAMFVLDTVQDLQPQLALDQIAILYRTNAQSRAFEEVMVQRGVPYRIVGGLKFYERKEIKDVLSYLRLLLNPADEVSQARATKLGKRRLQSIVDQRDHFVQVFSNHPAELLENILKVTKYRDKYNPEDPEEYSKLENIQELLDVASQFRDSAQFLENIALVQNDALIDAQDQDQATQGITLMSLHAAKGLEFPAVFMVGMEDGLLPHSRSLFDPEQMEEERRLCYVGITRAKQHLYFTYARSRWGYGKRTQQLRSRFINDIPPEYIDKLNSMGDDQPTTPKTQPKRRLDLNDSSLERVLSGELDVDEFLEW